MTFNLLAISSRIDFVSDRTPYTFRPVFRWRYIHGIRHNEYIVECRHHYRRIGWRYSNLEQLSPKVDGQFGHLGQVAGSSGTLNVDSWLPKHNGIHHRSFWMRVTLQQLMVRRPARHSPRSVVWQDRLDRNGRWRRFDLDYPTDDRRLGHRQINDFQWRSGDQPIRCEHWFTGIWHRNCDSGWRWFVVDSGRHNRHRRVGCRQTHDHKRRKCAKRRREPGK